MAPDWIDKKHELKKWQEPWNVELASDKDKDFKAKLWEHGLLSPHFTRAEAASRSARYGTQPIPESLRTKAQYHAFALERVRHVLGDNPISPLDWYRSPQHNAEVGGVANSQHLFAWATDWSNAPAVLSNALAHQFANGGRGYQGVVGGTIRHVDNGPARTWTY
jgi:zinc D-Ala-D-Ala carboxypeptidase